MRHFLLRLLLFLALALAVAELFFRFVVPASDQPRYTQNSRYHILQFDTNQDRDGLFTTGRLVEDRVPWHVNNAGWNAAIDYLPLARRTRPLIAVVGDSYVEGFYVAWPEHFASRLARHLGGQADVYAFGASGMPFSQYILMLRYLQSEFQPDWVVMFVGNGDLRGSLADKANTPGALQFRQTPDGRFLAKEPDPVLPGFRRHLRDSAVLRYLVSNAGLTLGMAAADNEAVKEKHPKAKPSATADEALYRAVGRHILGQMGQVFPAERTVFLIDGPRSALSNGETDPPTLLDGRILQELTAELGGHVVDLRPRFNAEWRANERSFCFPRNYHWNAYANDLVGQELAGFFQALPESLRLDKRTGRSR